MAQVDVTINNRSYRIACDDGQEEHLSRLAQYVDQRVQELVAAVGQVGDARLLVMASLLIADELSETMGALQQRQEREGSAAPGADTGTEQDVAAAMETFAQRIERIAAKLEAA